MRNLKCFVTFIMLFIFSIVTGYASEDYYIRRINVRMEFTEDGKIHIEEKISPFFKRPKHGIYRTIPEQFEFIDENGKQRYIRFPLSNFQCLSCEVFKENKQFVVRLGNPNQTMTGLQTYDFSYDVQMQDLNLEDKQLLFYNIVGDEFDTEIHNVKFEIVMPKDFDATSLEFFVGDGTKNEDLEWEVEDRIIRGELKENLEPYEGITIKLDLPKNYFQYSNADQIPWMLLYYVVIFTGIIIIIVLVIRCRKKEKILPVISFQSPKGLNSAAVGFIIDGIADLKDVYSLFFYWADKGMVSIAIEEDDFELKKLKDADLEIMKPYEYHLFQMLFQEDEVLSSRQLRKSKFDEAFNRAKRELELHYTNVEEAFHKKKQMFRNALWYSIIIMILVFGICVFSTLYRRVGLHDSIIYGFIIIGLNCLSIVILKNQYSKKYILKVNEKKYSLKNYIVFIAIGVEIVLYILMHIYLYYVYQMPILFALLTIMTYCGLCFYLITLINVYTEKGKLWLQELLGLREFILKCEKDQINMFVKENPEQFYHVLPFAYVLNVNKILMDKVEQKLLHNPNWIITGESYIGLTLFDRIDMIQSTMISSMVSNTNLNVSSSASIHSNTGGSGFGGGGGGSW